MRKFLLVSVILAAIFVYWTNKDHSEPTTIETKNPNEWTIIDKDGTEIITCDGRPSFDEVTQTISCNGEVDYDQ